MVNARHIRIAWISALAVLIGSLLWLAIAPFGRANYSTDFLDRSYFIGQLTPKDRLAGESGASERTMVGEPTYFSLFTSRPFRIAALTIEIDHPAPLVEVGIRRDPTVWNFERWPVYFETLEKLAQSPDTIREDGVMLWQRKQKFASIDDFLKNLPPVETIAAYNYRLSTHFQAPSYAPLPFAKDYDVGLRGNYSLHTYSNGDPIEVTFHFRDLNINKDPDTVTVTIYDEEGKGIETAIGEDDKGEPDIESGERELHITTSSLKPGAYRIEFKSNDDIVTDQVITRQSKLAFIGRLWLAQKSRKNFVLYTDGTYLSAQTVNPSSLQAIRADGERLELTKTYEQTSVNFSDQSRRIKKIEIPSDDIIISGDGVFSFASEAIINPTVRQLNERTNLMAGDVDYVIARYEPLGRKRFVSRMINIGLTGAYREKGAYSFMIAAPGIEATSGMEIRSLSVQLIGQTLSEFIERLWQGK